MPKSLLFFFFIVGIFFRLSFIQLYPQPFVFDQGEYHDAAVGIIRDGLYVDSHRTYGYPLLIALSYKIFGSSFFSWKLMQAILDSASAVLVYLMAKRIFNPPSRNSPLARSRDVETFSASADFSSIDAQLKIPRPLGRGSFKNGKAAFFSFFLCLFNPVTSGLVGVALSEVATGFFLTLCFFLFLIFLQKRKVVAAIPLGLACGFLPEVRPNFVFFTTIIMILVFIMLFRAYKKMLKKIAVLLAVFCAYLLPFTYAIAGNLHGYKQFSLLTVDNLFVREFYISLYIDRSISGKNIVIPYQVNWIYQEYSAIKTREEREAITQKYLRLSIEKIRENPKIFLLGRLAKLWYVWEKHAFFIYGKLGSEVLHQLIYWTNVVLLLLTAYGILSWRASSSYVVWFGRIFVLVVVYTSIIHAFAMTDGRFSIPIYPLIFLFCGYGIRKVGGKLS